MSRVHAVDVTVDIHEMMDTKDLNQKLLEAGLDPDCAEAEKVIHLWNLYIKTQAELNASLANIGQLRSQQETEMKEVEHYVEHIRSLSDEREALTLEFEAENEQLKGQVESLRTEVEGEKFNKETESMLLQQGLSDIARSSSSEQVAYLLVERARLLDELEAEQQRSVEREQTSNDLARRLEELQTELSEDKEDFEEDLADERETGRKMKEVMRAGHEEEMGMVRRENGRLQEMLNTATSKMTQLEQELRQLQSSSMGESKLLTKNDRQEESGGMDAIDGMSSDVDELIRELSERKAENDALRTKISELNDELESEKLETEDKVEERDKTIQKLRDEIERQHKYIAELQTSANETVAKRSTSEKKSVEIQLNFTEQQLEDSQASEQRLRAANKKLQSGEELRQEKSERDLYDIEEEKSKLSEELMSLKEKLRLKDRQILILEGRVSSAPKSLSVERQASYDAKVTDIEEKLQQTDEKPKAHLEDLKHRMQTVVQGKEELRRQLEQQEKQIGELKNELKEKSARLRLMEKATDELESINEELSEKLTRTNEQFSKCKRDLEEEQYKGEEREMEFEQQLLHLKTEADTLRRQLNVTEMTLRNKDDVTQQVQVKSDDQVQMLQEKMEATTRQWETDKVNWTRKQEQSSGETKMLKDTLSQKELEMSHVKDDCAMLRSKKTQLERETETLRQQQFLEKDELEREIETMRERHSSDKTTLERTIETMQQRESVQKTNREREIEALKQQDLVHRKQLKEDMKEAESNTRIEKLESEMKMLTRNGENEKVNLTRKLEKMTDEVKQLKQDLFDKKQEICQLDEESATMRAEKHKLERELETTIEREHRNISTNKQLIIDKSEFQSKLRRLEESVRTLEAANLLLQRRCEEASAADSMVKLEPNTIVVRALEKRAEVAEKQWGTLSSELFKAQSKSDHLLQDMSSLKSKLHSRDSEIMRLHKQMERETAKCCRANEVLIRLEQQIAGLKEKEKTLHNRNSELQHRLIDVEGKIEVTLNGQRSNTDQTDSQAQLKLIEDSMKECVECADGETEAVSVHQQLVDLQAKYDAQLQKYTERKIRTKVKLHRAREVFDTEKSRLRSQLESLQHSFETVKKQYSEVEVWQRHLQEGNIKLLTEKGKLHATISELEEQQSSHDRQLSMMRVQVHYLEDENCNLQERFLFVVKQKQSLGRLLEEYQVDRQETQEQDEELSMEMAGLVYRRVHLSNTSSGIDSMEQSCLHVDTGHSPCLPLASPSLDLSTIGHSVNALSDQQSLRYGIDLALDY